MSTALARAKSSQSFRAGDREIIDIHHGLDSISLIMSWSAYDSESKAKKRLIKYQFQVRSEDICRTSRVFKEMIGNIQRQKTATRMVEIPSFNPRAMAVVLRLLHGQREFVPENPGLPLLVEIARVVHYYECAWTIKPANNEWLRDLDFNQSYEKPFFSRGVSPSSKPNATHDNAPYWLFISWALRHAKAFHDSTATLICSSYIHPSVPLPLPEQLLDHIQKRQRDIILFLRQRIRLWRHYLRRGQFCGRPCDQVHLDAVDFALSKHDIATTDLCSRDPNGIASVPNFLDVTEALLKSRDDAIAMGEGVEVGCRWTCTLGTFEGIENVTLSYRHAARSDARFRS